VGEVVAVDGQLTKTQATAVAEAVVALRPGWSHSAVMAALLAVSDRGGFDVAIAALTAAADPLARTPAVITSEDGPHWPAWSPAAIETAEERDRRRTREIRDRRVTDEIRQIHRRRDLEGHRRGYAAATAELLSAHQPDSAA
jgi:hypothetical protein